MNLIPTPKKKTTFKDLIQKSFTSLEKAISAYAGIKCGAVYALQIGKDVYIGSSYNLLARLKQHRSKIDNKIITGNDRGANVIYSKAQESKVKVHVLYEDSKNLHEREQLLNLESGFIAFVKDTDISVNIISNLSSDPFAPLGKGFLLTTLKTSVPIPIPQRIKTVKKRLNATGRKPLNDSEKKERVVLYIRKDVIEGWGEAALKAHLVKVAETTKVSKSK